MRAFGIVFKYELLRMIKGRGYRLLTLLMMLALAVGLSLPRLAGSETQSQATEPQAGPREQVALLLEGISEEAVLPYLEEAFPAAEFISVNEEETLPAQVEQQEYAWALVVESGYQYRYIAAAGDAYGSTSEQVAGALTRALRISELTAQGVPPEAAQSLLASTAEGETVQAGEDPMEHFMHTYIMLFLLYMAILMYGSMVASGVGAEKTTRAMEVLITSAKPAQLMFGKVLGLGTAGLLQLFLVLLTGKVAYTLNAAYWATSPLVASIFDMPVGLLLYLLLFFVLGFFLYAFLYGAAGSLVNRTEELNSAIMPVLILFVAAFLVVVMGTTSGMVDQGMMKIASFIPFSSPMAMFARIAMGQPAPWEIALSIALLVGSVLLIGYAAAGIYRLGVLLYGQKPGLKTLWQAIRRQNV